MIELTVRGTAYERGRLLGARFGGVLRRDVAQGRTRLFRGWTLDAAEAAAGNVLFAMLRYVPHYVEELRGLADGSGIAFRDAFVLNTAPAYGPLRAAFGAGDVPAEQDGTGCSNVAVPQTEHGPVLVKTVDGGRDPALRDAEGDNQYLVQHVVPEDGDGLLPYTMVNLPGRLWPELGMNAAGLAAGQSSVPPLPGQRGHGVPVQWIIRPVLERCRTVEEAVDLLASLPMSGKGMNIGLADAFGGAAGVEKCAGRQAVFWPRNGYVAVTNAYRSPEMAAALPSLHPRNSDERLRALEHLFTGPLGEPASHTEAALLGVLRYHADRPGLANICQHGAELYTYHGFLLWPRLRELWGTDGYPCQAPLQTFVADPERRAAAARGAGEAVNV